MAAMKDRTMAMLALKEAIAEVDSTISSQRYLKRLRNILLEPKRSRDKKD
jgi:hypothetical protein